MNLLVAFLLGIGSGIGVYSFIYIPMNKYTRIWYTEYITGVKLEIFLLLIPAGLSSMSGTEAIVAMGIGMSLSLSVSELFFAQIHRSFPSYTRLHVFWLKNNTYTTYFFSAKRKKISLVKAISMCKNIDKKHTEKMLS